MKAIQQQLHLSELSVGDRVRIRETSEVCSYLWGHTGTIERIKPAEQLTFSGPFVVAFDEPRPQPAEYWSQLVTCAFESNHLEIVT